MNPAGVWVRAANSSDLPTDVAVLTAGNGQATLNLADGAYRFCANVGGYTTCSAQTADCTPPGCTSKEIIASAPGQARVSAFVGETDTGVSASTGLGGFATFPLRCTRGRASTLPQGSYRFKVEQCRILGMCRGLW